MKEEIRKAYSEIYEILQFLDDEYINKLPKTFIEFIEEEKDEDHVVTINPNIPLEEQNLLEDTINILAILNLDYWCTAEEKKELLSILNQNEQDYQAELNAKYNPDNIFKKRKNIQLDGKIEENSLIIAKEKNIILKLFQKIKSMLKKK